MRPWIIPMSLVLLVVSFGLAPWVGLAVLLVVFAVIVRTLYRYTKDEDYYELRRNDPAFRAYDNYLRGRRFFDR